MRTALAAALVLFSLAVPASLGFSQTGPEYAFVNFQAGYQELIETARSRGYQIGENEVLSPYGAYQAALDRTGELYDERISLFFDQTKQLIFYSVRFTVRENQSRTIIKKLIDLIREKLVQKYGESERDTVPYFRVYENRVEILVYPPSPTSENARISYKNLERYGAFQQYYEQESGKLIDQAIQETVDNL